MVALRAIALLGHDVVIFVHRKELLRQWVAEIKRVLGVDAAIYGGGVDTRSSGSPITVCMIQTAEKDREYIPAPFIIIDECHTVASDTAYKVAMRCNAAMRMGLSATPTREDGSEKKIFGACGALISQVTVNDLVDAGFLATPTFRLYRPEPVSMTKWASFSEAYRMGIVANENRNELVVRAAITMLGEDRQVYVHVSRIGHGRRIASMIPDSVFCSGTTKNRTEIIEQFKNGEIKCLISTLLKEGVDIPGINGLIYAAGGKSEVALIQTLGRSLRKKKDGGNAVIVDLLDSGNRHLKSHSEDRLDTLSRTYGKLFKVEIMS
jgi:superfamily II DNA or RNA helicase